MAAARSADGRNRHVVGQAVHRGRQDVRVKAVKPDGSSVVDFTTTCRVDTPVEVDYYRNGGILQTVLRGFLEE